MKQVKLLSIAFSFLSFSINNQEILAAGPPPLPKGPAPAPPPPKADAPKGPDPRYTPAKFCSANCAGTVKPAPTFNAKADAQAINNNMRGQIITPILTKRSNIQRLEIAQAFETEFKGDLVREFTGRLDGDYKAIVVALMTPLPVYFAKELHANLNKKGTDEKMLVEHLGSLSSGGIKIIAEFYKELHRKALEDDIKRETKGQFQKLMLSLVQGTRSGSPVVDKPKAAADAQALMKARDAKNWPTEQSELTKIFSSRGNAQLKQIFIEYEKLAKVPIDQDIKKIFPDGKESVGLMSYVEIVKSKDEFIAQRIWHSLKGTGTKEATLTRIVVSRSELDLGNIKLAFHKLHGKSLEAAVSGDTSGAYQDILLALIKGNQAKG